MKKCNSPGESFAPPPWSPQVNFDLPTILAPTPVWLESLPPKYIVPKTSPSVIVVSEVIRLKSPPLEPWISKSYPGSVTPMPTLPALVILMRSAIEPPVASVSNTIFAESFAPSWYDAIIARFVSASFAPNIIEPNKLVLSPTDLWSIILPPEVLTIWRGIAGLVVPMPTLPLDSSMNILVCQVIWLSAVPVAAVLK